MWTRRVPLALFLVLVSALAGVAQLNRVSGNQIFGGTASPDAVCLNGSTADTCLQRDGAADTLAQSRGTNAQTFRWYGTRTDASNYERLAINYTAQEFLLKAESAGSGAQRNLHIGNATGNWFVNSTTPHWLASSDNAYDIGAVASSRPRTGYFGTSVVAPLVNATTGVQIGGAATSGQFLVGNGTNFVGAAPALVQQAPADATARSSSGGTFVMMGLGADTAGSGAHPCSITPVATGRVVFRINGDIVNNTTATTISIKLVESTGAAPANNAAASGTVISATKVIDGLTSALTVPFHIEGTATGLALATAVWFDVQLTTSSTNTGRPTVVDCIATEM